MVVKKTDSIVQDAIWGEIETLGGMEMEDKANLQGVTLVITGYKFTHNDVRKISYVYCEYETSPGGEKKNFNDSSANGIRFEMEEFHLAKNAGKTFELDKWYDTKLMCPQGLRLSEFPAKDERGRDVTGRAFYLTRTNTGRV